VSKRRKRYREPSFHGIAVVLVDAHDRAPAVLVVLGTLEQSRALSSPTIVLVLESNRPRRLASSLTPMGSAAATARSAVAWRLLSEARSIASRIGIGAGTALFRSWSVTGTSEVSSMRSSSTSGRGSVLGLVLTGMIGLLLSFDLRTILKMKRSLIKSITGGLT